MPYLLIVAAALAALIATVGWIMVWIEWDQRKSDSKYRLRLTTTSSQPGFVLRRGDIEAVNPAEREKELAA